MFLVSSIAQGTPKEIESDYQRLKQILINILRNSTKFTFKGYIQIGVRPAMMRAMKGNKVLTNMPAVQFIIYDTGIGISEENQQGMFKLFGKVQQKNKSINKEGIGLGLYITKNLMTELGGLITLDSTDGEGHYTQFTLTLPLKRNMTFTQEEIKDLEQKGVKVPAELIADGLQPEDEETGVQRITLLLDTLPDVYFDVLP